MRAAREVGQHVEELVRLHVLASVAEDEQQRRRVRRSEDLGEPGGAVEIAPLEIVDEQDDALAIGEAREHLVEGGEAAPADLERVAEALEATRLRVDDALEDGEEPRERAEVARQERAELELR